MKLTLSKLKVNGLTFNSLLHKSLNLSITSEVDVHNLVPVVANVKRLVCPHVVLLLPVVPLLHVPHYTPHRQIVDVHLVPIVVLDSVQKGGIGLLLQFDGAVVGLTDVFQESYLQSAELQLHALQRLPHRLVVMADVLLWTLAEREGKVSVTSLVGCGTARPCSSTRPLLLPSCIDACAHHSTRRGGVKTTTSGHFVIT